MANVVLLVSSEEAKAITGDAAIPTYGVAWIFIKLWNENQSINL